MRPRPCLRSVDRLAEGRHLAIPPDQGRGQSWHSARNLVGGAEPEDAERGDGQREPLEGEVLQALTLDQRGHEPVRLHAGDDAAAHGLQPRRQVRDLAGHQELAALLRRRDGLSRGEPNAEVQARAILPLEHRVQGGEALPHRHGRPHGTFGIVLVQRRHTEHGHDGVARVLLHGPAVGADLLGHLLEEGREQRAELLGIVPRGERGGPDEVGEDHRHNLPLFGRSHRNAPCPHPNRSVAETPDATGVLPFPVPACRFQER